MEANDTDKIFAEIFNGILNKYCREMGFEEYADYEFMVFYVTKNNNERSVGAISGNIDNAFIDGISSVLSQLKGDESRDDHGRSEGLVDQ